MVQLSRYERIEEEGESRSGNYEREGERAREGEEEGEEEGEPSHSCWFMARAVGGGGGLLSHIPGPVTSH